MTTTTWTVFGAVALLAMTIASANAQKPAAQTPTAQTPAAPTSDQAKLEQSKTAQSQESSARSTPLLHLGKVDVGVWAPVQPVYDAGANRNLAADSLWSFDSPPAHSGF